MRIIELFGGIGACTQALKEIIDTKGGNQQLEILDYVEIDKYAVKSYNAINETNFEPQDITTWNKHFDDVDLIMHGSPCQDFSISGKQLGGDKNSGTRSSLMYETIRIVSDIKPKYVIWENVKNLLSKKHRHNFDAYLQAMEEIGYKNYYQVLNAKDYGIPQNRERVFTISIRNDISKEFVFPNKINSAIKTKDLLENNVDNKYYLSNRMLKYISESGTKNFKLNDSKINLDIARPLTTDQNKRAGTTNYISEILPDNYDISVIKLGSLYNKQSGSVYSGEGLTPTITTGASNNWNILLGEQNNETLKIRKLTPKECWRLMGFKDECFDRARDVNSDTQLYKQAGNSIVVNVLFNILNNLI